MIPAAFGLLLAMLGFGAKSNENLRKHLMHAAVIVGLVGFIVPLTRLIPQMSQIKISLAVLSQAAMSLICLVFVILCVKSFINARRNRTAEI